MVATIKLGTVRGLSIQFNQESCQFNALDNNNVIVASAGSKAYLIKKIKTSTLNTVTYEKLKGLEICRLRYDSDSVPFTLTGGVKKKGTEKHPRFEKLQVKDSKGSVFWIDDLYCCFKKDIELCDKIEKAHKEEVEARKTIIALRKKLKPVRDYIKDSI